MNYKLQIQKAADEYRNATGFVAQNYDQSAGQPDANRFAALKVDIRWFDDHASEAKQRVERLLRNIDTDDLSNGSLILNTELSGHQMGRNGIQ